jgi:hypothetical protein
MEKLSKLVDRLKKINIEIMMFGNYPWIYLDTVNGNKVKETFHANHGFDIMYYSQKDLIDIKETFKIIRKYK